MKKEVVMLLIKMVILMISIPIYSQPKMDLEILERITKEINKLTFNTNLHFHPAYTQSHLRVEKFYGKISREVRYNLNGGKTEYRYNRSGQVLSVKKYRKDTLINEYLYEYDEVGNIKSERGRHEVDYFQKDEKTIIGLPTGSNKMKFYRAEDSIFMFFDKNIYEIRRKLNDGEDIDEKYKFKYTGFGELETIDIYSNNVRYGQIKNIYNSRKRITEHQFFHSFSSFSLTQNWSRHFRNSVYLFEYDEKGFWNQVTREEYNAENRSWEQSSKRIEYKIERHKGGYKIMKTVNQEGAKIYYNIELDEQYNWIKQNIKTGEEVKIIKRKIEYYN